MTDNNNKPTLHCVACYQDLEAGGAGMGMVMVILKPCNHHVCSTCMLDWTMTHRFQPFLYCPDSSCRQPFTAYQHYNTEHNKQDGHGNNVQVNIKDVPEKKFIQGINDVEKVCTDLAQLDDEEKKNLLSNNNEPLLVVSASKITLHENSNGTLVIQPVPICLFQSKQTTTSTNNAGGAGGTTTLDFGPILKLFAALHGPLVQTLPDHSDAETTAVIHARNPSSLFQFIRDSPLHNNPLQQSLLALASGVAAFDLTKASMDNTHHQSAFFATQLAADLLLRVKQPNNAIGQAVRLLTDAVASYESPYALLQLLTRFRIITELNLEEEEEEEEES